MTKFERDFQKAQNGSERQVITERRKEIDGLRAELKKTSNAFRATCLLQEIGRRESELEKIEALFA